MTSIDLDASGGSFRIRQLNKILGLVALFLIKVYNPRVTGVMREFPLQGGPFSSPLFVLLAVIVQGKGRDKAINRWLSV